MHVTSEVRRDDGVVERGFTLAGVPGILWTPACASESEPVPLVLLGLPPLGLSALYPRLVARAGACAAAGLAAVTMELPGSGVRPLLPGVQRARAELWRAREAGEPVGDELVESLVLPLVEAAVPEWRALLDAVLVLPEIGGPVGLSGGVISLGVRLLVTDPRVAAAVLFAGSVVPRVMFEEAARVRVPLHVLLQWDDEGNDRQASLELFDAFGSQEKSLHANMGGHAGVPASEGLVATQFFARHLR